MRSSKCSVRIDELRDWLDQQSSDAATDSGQGGEHPIETHLNICPHCQSRIVQELESTDLQAVRHRAAAAPYDLSPEVALRVSSAFRNASDQSLEEYPQRIGGYDILGEIGRGGMGIVYRARDNRLSRDVAIKALLPRAVSPELRSRFVREGRAMASIDDRGVIPIFEVIDDPVTPALVMPLMTGGPLSNRIERQDYSFQDAATWTLEIAEALITVHRKGYIHRDIKPANVLLDDHGRVRIGDFGLVRWSSGVQITEHGALTGTPEYLSPESVQSDAGAISEAGDLYQCGVLLYELLCGQPPFQGSIPEILSQVVASSHSAPRTRRKDVPKDLETICLTAMERRPSDRYASAWELANDLRCYLQGRPILAKATPVWSRAGRKIRSHPWLSIATSLAVICIGIAGGMSLRLKNEVRQAQGEVRAIGIEKDHLQSQILSAVLSGLEPRPPQVDQEQAVNQFIAMLVASMETSLSAAIARNQPAEVIGQQALGVAGLQRRIAQHPKRLDTNQLAVTHLDEAYRQRPTSALAVQVVMAHRLRIEALLDHEQTELARESIPVFQDAIKRIESDPHSFANIEHFWLELFELRLAGQTPDQLRVQKAVQAWKNLSAAYAANSTSISLLSDAGQQFVRLLRSYRATETADQIEAALNVSTNLSAVVVNSSQK